MATSRTELNRSLAYPHGSAEALLWTLRKNGRSIQCAVHSAEEKVELRIRRDGELCAGSAFEEFDQAVAYGNALLLDLHATGWRQTG
jgi:hypothetical protein